MASLDIEGVSQGFGDIKVLDAINLHVESGQVACLLGPSGCGKTTLFHVIAGLSRPWSGRVLLDGRDITGQSGRLAYMLKKICCCPIKRFWTTFRFPWCSRANRVNPLAIKRATCLAYLV